MPPLDPLTVVGIVAIINAVAAAGALLITTWFTARRRPAGTRTDDLPNHQFHDEPPR
jgi:hypothetical protein